MLTGSLVAIVTPMHEDGSLDLDCFRRLLDFHVREGTEGIVSCIENIILIKNLEY